MDLLKNACLSIVMGIQDLNSNKEERMLSAIRNLHAGIILLFKEKLRRMSPADSNEALIKSKVVPVERKGEIVFVGVGNTTVNIVAIRKHFESLCIKVDWSRVDKLTVFRNDIEHYYSQVPFNSMHEALMSTFLLVKDFMEIHLAENPVDHFGQDVWGTLVRQREVHDSFKSECLKALNKLKWKDELVKDIIINNSICKRCGSTLVIPENGTIDVPENATFKCKQCNTIATYEEYLEASLSEFAEWDEYERAKYGAEPQLEECPSCDEMGYICRAEKCIYCGYELEFDICIRCGAQLELSEQSFDGYCNWCHHQEQKTDTE